MDIILTRLADALSMNLEYHPSNHTSISGAMSFKLKEFPNLPMRLEVLGSFRDRTAGETVLFISGPGDLRLLVTGTSKLIQILILNAKKLPGFWRLPSKASFQPKTSMKAVLSFMQPSVVAGYYQKGYDTVWSELDLNELPCS